MALDRDKRGEISGELEVAEEEMREINDWKVPMAKDTLLFFVAVVQIVTKLRGMGEGWERDGRGWVWWKLGGQGGRADTWRRGDVDETK